jgi:hypothetical protein
VEIDIVDSVMLWILYVNCGALFSLLFTTIIASLFGYIHVICGYSLFMFTCQVSELLAVKYEFLDYRLICHCRSGPMN